MIAKKILIVTIFFAFSVFLFSGFAIAQLSWEYNPATGHEYLYIFNSSTWSDAENQAVSLGGHLVTINDQAEQDWLYNTFWAFSLNFPSSIWIGLNDLNNNNTWEWISGEVATYFNWGVNEPNMTSGWNVVRLSKANDFDWHTLNGTYMANAIVERPIAPEPINSALFVIGAITMGFMWLWTQSRAYRWSSLFGHPKAVYK